MDMIIEIIKAGYGWYLFGGLILSGIIAEVLSQVKYDCSTLHWKNLAIGALGTFIGLPIIGIANSNEHEALMSFGIILMLISWLWNLVFTTKRSNLLIAILAIPTQTLLSFIAAFFISSAWRVVKDRLGV